MDQQDIINRLKENEPALRAQGVLHAALFGSRARGEEHAASDTDIMIEVDPEARVGIWEYAGIKDYIASLFEGPVDVVAREGLKPHLRPAVTAVCWDLTEPGSGLCKPYMSCPATRLLAL